MSAKSPADRGFRIRGLGEVAIRCDDLGRMAAFYGGTLGLAAGDVLNARSPRAFRSWLRRRTR